VGVGGGWGGVVFGVGGCFWLWGLDIWGCVFVLFGFCFQWGVEFGVGVFCWFLPFDGKRKEAGGDHLYRGYQESEVCLSSEHAPKG